MKTVKLICSRVILKPEYKEDMVTEIPERIFCIDGYEVFEKLEGIIFNVHFNKSGKILSINIGDKSTEEYLENSFNSKRYYNEVKKYAERIMETGDEVEVPDFIKTKYFKDDINVAVIVVSPS